MRKKVKQTDLRQSRWLRWLFSAFVLILLFYLTESQIVEEINPGESPVLYANICHDPLEKMFAEAIRSANHSILLMIYSLSDHQLIEALNEKAQKGVAIKVYHDQSTPTLGFDKLSKKIEKESMKRTGLMHQKVLVVDSEKVWIGSANMTSESLKMHDNLVIGLVSPQLARAIETQTSHVTISHGEQIIEYWDLPKSGKEALQKLIHLMDGAKKTIRVAMFTWTHIALTDAIIRAHNRGVSVEVIIDHGQAQGVGQQTLLSLVNAGLHPQLSSGPGLLHHKFAWIDGEILINGSMNWTKSALTRNRDCFLILAPLTEQQRAKMEVIWRKTLARSKSATALNQGFKEVKSRKNLDTSIGVLPFQFFDVVFPDWRGLANKTIFFDKSRTMPAF